MKIEFSRISVDGRLTLVIDPVHGTDVTTQYAESKHVDLAAAIEDLRKREGTTRTNMASVVRAKKEAEISNL